MPAISFRYPDAGQYWKGIPQAGFDKHRLFYTQGDYGLWQCGEPCHDTTYDNETIIKKMVAEQENMRIPSGLIPHCPVCGAPMSMNLRADSTFVEDDGWHTAAKRYQDFVRRHKGLDILYLELGVGGNQRKPKRRTDSAARSWYEKKTYEQT